MQATYLKQQLELMIHTNKLITFDYVAKDLAVSQKRTVFPLSVIFDKNNEPIAFKAIDIDKKDFRIFQFEGMMNWSVKTTHDLSNNED